MATSTSPEAKALSITAGWLAVSSASKSMTSTALAPALRSWVTASSRPGSPGRAGQHDAGRGVAQIALTDRQPDL